MNIFFDFDKDDFDAVFVYDILADRDVGFKRPGEGLSAVWIVRAISVEELIDKVKDCA